MTAIGTSLVSRSKGCRWELYYEGMKKTSTLEEDQRCGKKQGRKSRNRSASATQFL